MSDAVSKKMNLSPNNGDNTQFQPTGTGNVSSIVHELSASFNFRNSEDLHNILLSAAQTEHERVRENALRLLEREQARYDQEITMKKARIAEERARIEIEKAIEAKKKEQDSKDETRQPPKSTQSVPTLPLDKNSLSLSTSQSVSIIQQNPLPVRPINSFSDRLTAQNLPSVTFSIPQNIDPNSIAIQSLSPLTTTSTSNVPNQSTVASASLLCLESNELSSKPLHPNIDASSTIPRTLSTPLFSKVALLSNEVPSSQSVKPTDPAIVETNRNHDSRAATSDSSTTSNQKFFKQSFGPDRIDRYKEIHKNMKNLRKQIESQGGQPTNFRTSCKKGRREITKALGQLIVDARNTAIVDKVIRQLRDSLQDKTEMIDVSMFIVKNRRAISAGYLNEDGVDMNGDKLPVAFIYHVGAFCKAICAQLVNEAALKPQAASPIGILAARIFSDPRLYWRGDSLIDMLISKIFIVCPILFGVCGDESTQEGRLRIGWRKTNGKFISEQAHYDRMSGIAAGYAAISLRDFSKTRWKNPYPPTNYWSTVSAIVNTSRKEVSSTQYVVLKSLIEHSFSRFITFYGDMAIAALQAALVEFPKRASEENASVGSLRTLCATLQKDHGLIFR
ncbi:putative gle1-like protein [Erysiphe neolycopersici]|uniref:mRNA export factor GLE1 n=1 Tax=Erysiphe neolycopersici TaxID=212602 RepID=A0A420I8A3_9PEZI|nr:putative gle1-like protein [Erysiphe neolycopersici]